jgi:hypothetical protein
MTLNFRNHRSTRKLRLVVAAALILLVSGATYAYTAANSVASSQAGFGTGTVTGYVLTPSSVHYTIDTASNPANPGISAVAFTTDTKPTDIRVQLTTGGSWYTCNAPTGASAPFSVTCPTTSPSETAAAAVGPLAVVAVS